MQTRHVAVFRKQNVAALATAVHTTFGNGESIARRVATDHQGESPDITLCRAAEALHPICRSGLLFELLIANNLLPDSENVAEIECPWFMGPQLQIHSIE